MKRCVLVVLVFVLCPVMLCAQFSIDAMLDFRDVIKKILTENSNLKYRKITFTEKPEGESRERLRCPDWFVSIQYEFLSDSIVQSTGWGGCPEDSFTYKKSSPTVFLVRDTFYFQKYYVNDKFEIYDIEKYDSAGFSKLKVLNRLGYELYTIDSNQKLKEYLRYQYSQSIINKTNYLDDSISYESSGFDRHPVTFRTWFKTRMEFHGDSLRVEIKRRFQTGAIDRNAWEDWIEEIRKEWYFNDDDQLVKAWFIKTCSDCWPRKSECTLDVSYEK